MRRFYRLDVQPDLFGSSATSYGVQGTSSSATTGAGGYFANGSGGYGVASGNVGIGTLTPAQALEVNGHPPALYSPNPRTTPSARR